MQFSALDVWLLLTNKTTTSLRKTYHACEILLGCTTQANRLAHRLPEKLAEGRTPHCPSDKLSWWWCSELQVRTSTSWGRGKYVGRWVVWIGCRWSRHWLSRGCTKSKRTATLGGLTIQIFTIALVLRVWGLYPLRLMLYHQRMYPMNTC